MPKDVVDLLIKMIEEQSKKMDAQSLKIEQLESKIDGLIAFKNRLIAGGVVLSAIFAYIWDWLKEVFARG